MPPPPKPGPGSKKGTAGQKGGAWRGQDGLWRPRLAAKYGRRILRDRTYKTHKEAAAFAKAEAQRIEDGYSTLTGLPGQPATSGRTVEDSVLEHIARTRTIKTRETYESVYRRMIQGKPLASLLVAALTPGDVSTWMNSLVPDHERDQRRQARSLVNSGLEIDLWANRVTAVVSRGVPLGKDDTKGQTSGGGPKRKVRVPTFAEMHTLLAACPDEPTRLMVEVMLWGGLRWAEVASLERAEVFTDKPYLSIAWVRVWKKGPPKVDENGEPVLNVKGRPLYEPGQWIRELPKTGTTGEVRLPRTLWERLVALPADNDQKDSEHPLVFPGTGRGGAWHNGSFSDDKWRPARTAAGLTARTDVPSSDPRRTALQIKDLRATAASILKLVNAGDVGVQTQLRHEDPMTARKHYSRDWPHSDTDRKTLLAGLDLTDPLEARDELYDRWRAMAPVPVNER